MNSKIIEYISITRIVYYKREIIYYIVYLKTIILLSK